MSKDGHVWPKTQTAPHPLISAREHLSVADGGESARTFDNVGARREGSKLPLNSWAVGRDGYTWENKRKSEEEGAGGRSGSPDSPLVKLTWLKQSQASLFSFPFGLCGGNPPCSQPGLVLSHSVGKHKLQKGRRSS